MDITKYIDQPGPQQDRPRFTRETQSSGPVRSRQVYISHANDWMLRALVKSQSGDYMTITTKDAWADAILTGYFEHNYPELAALYRERTALDDKAAETIKTAASEKQQKV